MQFWSIMLGFSIAMLVVLFLYKRNTRHRRHHHKSPPPTGKATSIIFITDDGHVIEEGEVMKIIVGQSKHFKVSGEDQYGNAVPIPTDDTNRLTVGVSNPDLATATVDEDGQGCTFTAGTKTVENIQLFGDVGDPATPDDPTDKLHGTVDIELIPDKLAKLVFNPDAE